MKRMILHIGLPKTGSSSLQWYLARNRAKLEAQDILYPSGFDHFTPDGNLDPSIRKKRLKIGGGKTWNHNNLRREIGSRKSDRRKFSTQGITLEKLDSALRYAPHETIIISAENLNHIAAGNRIFEPIRSIAPGADFIVDVCMFVRSQEKWANSVYTQNAKLLAETREFSDFSEDFIKSQKTTYKDKLAAWRGFRNAGLIAVPFTKQRLVPNLETAFLSAVGLEYVTKSLDPPDTSDVRNPSPGPKTIAACIHAARNFNETRRHAQGDLRERIGKAIQAEAENLGWNTYKFTAIDTEIRNRFERNFYKDNEAFALLHWGMSWRDVFAGEDNGDLRSNEIQLDCCSPADRSEICDVVGKVFAANGVKYSADPALL